MQLTCRHRPARVAIPDRRHHGDDQPDQTGPEPETETGDPLSHDTGVGAGDHTDDQDELVNHVDDEEEREGEQPRRAALTTSAVNALTIGELIFHYDARDVTMVASGADALRVLTMFRNRREGTLGDPLDPYDSNAANAWTVFDLGLPLQISWLPGLPTPKPRTAIDPALPAR